MRLVSLYCHYLPSGPAKKAALEFNPDQMGDDVTHEWISGVTAT